MKTVRTLHNCIGVHRFSKRRVGDINCLKADTNCPNSQLIFTPIINLDSSQKALTGHPKVKKTAYSGVPNRSAGTYAEFRLRRWRHGKFFNLLFKT